MSNCLHAVRTLRSDTRTVSINASLHDVFAVVSDPNSLPHWAVGFCRSIRHDSGDRWLATTPGGEIPIRFESNADAATVDFHFSPAPGIEVTAFSRVVTNAGGSEYIFTQFQIEGMSTPVFDAQVEALTEELQVLRSVIQARAACASSAEQT